MSTRARMEFGFRWWLLFSLLAIGVNGVVADDGEVVRFSIPRAPAFLVVDGRIYEDGRARVVDLFPGGQGPAERAGLKKGDVIEEFGTAGFHKVTASNVFEVLAAKAGTAVPVKVYRPSEVNRFETSIPLRELISFWNFAGKDN